MNLRGEEVGRGWGGCSLRGTGLVPRLASEAVKLPVLGFLGWGLPQERPLSGFGMDVGGQMMA